MVAGEMRNCMDPSTTLRFAQDDASCHFPEETMTLAVFKILFLSL